MKKINIVVLSFLIYFIFGGNGCNKRVYDALINYNSPTPIIFETVSDSNRVNKFLGADFRYSQGAYANENLALLRLTFNYVSTKDHAFSNTSIIGYGGYYNVDGLGAKEGANFTDVNFNGRKWGGGLIGNIKVGLNFKFTDFKLGSGIDFSAGAETGEFLDFRSSAEELGVIESNRGWASANFNLFLFGAFKLQNSSILNLQLNIGLPGGVSPILSYQRNETILWFSYLGDRGNVGIMKSLTSLF
jgi:hypothetical protein